MSRPEPRPPLRLTGTPRERGRAHGTALAGPIRAFLDDGAARLDHVVPEPADPAERSALLRAYGAVVSRCLPDAWKEIEGLADGAGITLEEAILLQCRRELMGYTRFPAGGDCTAIAASAPHPPLLAQTVDLTCEMHDQLRVLDVRGPDIAGGRACVLTFTGLLGYLGVNAAGLAVGLNLVLGGEWGPRGVPPYLAIRHLVDRAHSVDEALALLDALPLASSRNFVLCDRRRAVCVEAVEGRLRVTPGPVVVHANHVLHPDLSPLDTINPFSRNSSVRRQEALGTWWSGTDGRPADEDVLGALSRAPINVSGPVDMRREKTVAAVVLRPGTGEMAWRRGDPSAATTERTYREETLP